MVPGAQNAGQERQADDEVQPLLDHLAVDAGQLDEQVRQDGAHDELPHALDPQVHHPPAPVGIHRLVGGVDHARQVQQRRRQQPHEQHDARGGAAGTAPQRYANVEDEHQDVHHHQVIQRARDFEEFSPLPPLEVKADDGNDADQHQAGELCHGQRGRIQFLAGLVGNDEVRRAHEAAEQPDDEQVEVGGARHVEGNDGVQHVVAHVRKGQDEAIENLQAQQQHRYREEIVGDSL